MMTRKELAALHEERLKWLMDRWGLDKTNTLRYITSRAFHEERKKDVEGKPGATQIELGIARRVSC
jgi:hypothetical protein